MNPLLVPISRPDLGIYLPKQFPPQQGVAPGLAAVDKLSTMIQPVLDVQGTFRSGDRPSLADLEGAADDITHDWTAPLTDPNTIAWVRFCSGQHDDGTSRALEISMICVNPGSATIYVPLVSWMSCSQYASLVVPRPFVLAFGNGIRVEAPSGIGAGKKLRLQVAYDILWAGQYEIPSS